jgi:hypothetical protein
MEEPYTLHTATLSNCRKILKLKDTATGAKAAGQQQSVMALWMVKTL